MKSDPSSHVWKMGAPAGYGVMTTGLLLAKVATHSGYDIFDYAEYPSLIQGGQNTYEVVVGHNVVTTEKNVDLLICLDQATFKLHQHRLSHGALVLYDPTTVKIKPGRYSLIPVNWNQIIVKLKADKVMINMVALGASIGLWGGNLAGLKKIIKLQFGHKHADVAAKNIKCAQAGFNVVTDQYTHLIKNYLVKQKKVIAQAVITGNDAFALGAVAGDCRFYAAYPMSPSSSVLSTLAKWQKETGMIVRHAEDEIGVVNEALGASFTGVRASVGTSGGGFALMSESLSFAGIAELPLVIFLAQRPGPATGMPTWTEQGDLLFTVFGGHGEFPRIILAPGDVSEMIQLTTRAFNLAAQYQLPVIVLSDKYLSECHQSLPLSTLNRLMRPRLNYLKSARLTKNHLYKRYKLTRDGISPWLQPGTARFMYQTNSYEHSTDGHTSEAASDRLAQVDKRQRKIATFLAQDAVLPTIYGDKSSQTVLVGWGSVKGALQTAQSILAQKGHNVGIMHFTQLYPLPTTKLARLFDPAKKYILVENNATGQLGQILRMTVGVDIKSQFLKYDGRPICTDEVVQKVMSEHNL